MALAPVTSLRVEDIANPGYGPIYAVVAQAAGREWVFTDARVLTNDRAEAGRFLAKVAARKVIETNLWDPATMTPAEREAYLGPGGDLWQWEEQEKTAGRW